MSDNPSFVAVEERYDLMGVTFAAAECRKALRCGKARPAERWWTCRGGTTTPVARRDESTPTRRLERRHPAPVSAILDIFEDKRWYIHPDGAPPWANVKSVKKLASRARWGAPPGRVANHRLSHRIHCSPPLQDLLFQHTLVSVCTSLGRVIWAAHRR